MSELSSVWKVGSSSQSRWCYKYNITVTGCTHHIDCKDCEYVKKELKNVTTEPIKHRRKSSIHNLGDTTAVKKRVRKSQNGSVSGPISNEKVINIPKVRNNSKVRRRSESAYQERLIT